MDPSFVLAPGGTLWVADGQAVQVPTSQCPSGWFIVPTSAPPTTVAPPPVTAQTAAITQAPSHPQLTGDTVTASLGWSIGILFAVLLIGIGLGSRLTPSPARTPRPTRRSRRAAAAQERERFERWHDGHLRIGRHDQWS